MWTFIFDLVNSVVKNINVALAAMAPSQIVVCSVLTTAALKFIYEQYHNPWIMRAWRARNTKSLKQKGLDAGFEIAKHIPAVKRYLANELDKNLQSTREKLAKERASMNLRATLPKKGMTAKEILAEFEIDPRDCVYDFDGAEARGETVPTVTDDGLSSGALYTARSKEETELLKEVYGKTELTNPMHDKWPRISAMLAEVISWCQSLFHGSKEGYGILTHGGSTSIIEAMAAYVIHARARSISHPEIVVPETAHAAFHKAAELTGATLLTVPVDPVTGAVTTREMRKYLSGNTAVMVGSAPSFMNGIADPIKELGELAQEKKLPFHVDACLGGFLTAHLNTEDNPLDFRAKGVTSISADTHKYGFCPKGSSVCLFSEDSPALSVYAALGWPGGLYATAGILDGSVSGARVAEVFATMGHKGQEKYQAIMKNIVELRQQLQTAVEKVEGIEIFGDPKFSVLGFKSSTLNAHSIADELDKKGWKLNLLQKPDGFHFCLTHLHTLIDGLTDKFVKDLTDSIELVKAYPADKKPSGNVKVYGAIPTMPTQVQRDICVSYQREKLRLPTDSPLSCAAEARRVEQEAGQRLPPSVAVL